MSVVYRQVSAEGMRCSVVSNSQEIILNESDNFEFLGHENFSCRRSVSALADGTCQGAVMRSAQVTRSSWPAVQELPSKKTRTAVKVEEVCVRALHSPSDEPSVQERCRCLRSPSGKYFMTEEF